MTREQVWKALWSDPKYIQLQAHKDRVAKQWNAANSYKLPEEAKLSEAFTRASKAIEKYENAALEKASVPYVSVEQPRRRRK